MSETLRLLFERKWLLVLLWFTNLVSGYLIVTPWSEAIEASRLTQLPQAQVAMFSGGGLVLVEWLRLDGPQLFAALKAVLWLGAAATLMQLFPTALLIAAISDQQKLRLSRHAQRALVAMPPFVLAFGATLLVQALGLVLLGLGYGFAASHVSTGWAPWLSGLVLIGALPAWLLPQLFEDLTRVFVVHRQLPSLLSAREALRCCAARKLSLLGLFAAVSAIALTIAGLGLISAWRLSAQGSSALQFAVQQSYLLVLVVLRAFFLGRLVDIVNSWRPEPDDRRADSAVPAGPNPDRGA